MSDLGRRGFLRPVCALLAPGRAGASTPKVATLFRPEPLEVMNVAVLGRLGAGAEGLAEDLRARGRGELAGLFVDLGEGNPGGDVEGPVRVTSDQDDVATAVEAYARRYRQPKPRTDRVVIVIDVERVLGRA